MGIINLLDFQTANLIAAGEVVDRPASACKELVENSIDSGASSITVEIKNGGISLIRVMDNGKGMAREDIPLSILRHATSKIKTSDDLNSIATLGFRGEALAAISSVSHLRILSKRAEDMVGTQLECEPGGEPVISEIAIPNGTTVIAEELFASVPARRKFLKKDQTEAMAVTSTIEKIALSNPQIAMRLIIDGETKFKTIGDGILRNAIYSLLGREFASKLIPINRDIDGVKISGFIGTPDNVRANRNCQVFFINHRYVKSKCAQAALEQAFTSYSPAEKFPTCVMFIDISPESVDVNVHPAKLEVKFSNEKLIFESIYYAVRGSLEQNIPRPELRINGLDSSKDASYKMMKAVNAFVPIDDKKSQNNEPKSPYLNRKNVKVGQISFEDEPSNKTTETELPTTEPPTPANQANENIPTVEIPKPLPTSAISQQIEAPRQQIIPPQPQITVAEKPQKATHESRVELPEVIESGKYPPPKSGFVRTPPQYRIIGEAYYSYVFVEEGDKVLIIDKHAAHERIIFEELKQNLTTKMVVSQLLLVPIDVEMTVEEISILGEYKADVTHLGFDFQMKNDHIISVSAIPHQIEPSAVSDMLVTIADRILKGTGNARLSRDILFERALYQASCKAAIKAGQITQPEQIKWLCDKLLSLDDIKYCPHGRPVAFEISKANLEHQFKRT